jgi:hypothetical protein
MENNMFAYGPDGKVFSEHEWWIGVIDEFIISFVVFWFLGRIMFAVAGSGVTVLLTSAMVARSGETLVVRSRVWALIIVGWGEGSNNCDIDGKEWWTHQV